MVPGGPVWSVMMVPGGPVWSPAMVPGGSVWSVLMVSGGSVWSPAMVPGGSVWSVLMVSGGSVWSPAKVFGYNAANETVSRNGRVFKVLPAGGRFLRFLLINSALFGLITIRRLVVRHRPYKSEQLRPYTWLYKRV